MTTPLLPPSGDAPPSQIEPFVRAAMHKDRAPGVVLAVCHPLRMYKVPDGLFQALEAKGFEVVKVDTLPNRIDSVLAIRDALKHCASMGRPLDLLVFSGDGTLDHHVLVAAYMAFCPELVATTPAEVSLCGPADDERAAVPARLRKTFLDPLWDDLGAVPAGDVIPVAGKLGIDATEEAVHQFWVLRRRIDGLVRSNAAPWRIARRARLSVDDPKLRLLVMSVLWPDRVVVRAPGFDLSALADAPRETAALGLYPYIRSIAVYPCGTAADNALYAGIPGYIFASFAKTLRWPLLRAVRKAWGKRSLQRFLHTFTEGVVVPARFSLVAFDDRWSVISSHAAGGPGGGAFFAADLESKTGGLLGYLKRIPNVIINEALLGSTVLRVTTLDRLGKLLGRSEGRMVEALYTNRAFIAGVGGVPSTNPTSLAGQSSLILCPPILYRDNRKRLVVDFTGIATFTEAIVKGTAGRLMHSMGLGVGNLAGGGTFFSARAENQVTLQEGESVELEFLDIAGRRRAVATQVSGDPYQAWRMKVRVAWGPLPLLASPTSLLMAAAQRALTRLRVAQSWQLETVYIAGLAWLRHRVHQGDPVEQTGLCPPPWTLPGRLVAAQAVLRKRWEAQGTGPFIDTTEQGLALGRRGRYAHNSDHSAHLMLLQERGRLLVRQVRRVGLHIYEGRTVYSGWPGGWVIHENQVRRSQANEAPVIVQEEHFFRDAESLLQEAPSFFPFIGEGKVWADAASPAPNAPDEDVDVPPIQGGERAGDLEDTEVGRRPPLGKSDSK